MTDIQEILSVAMVACLLFCLTLAGRARAKQNLVDTIYWIGLAIILELAFQSVPAAAAEVPVWSGPTEYACDSRCEPGIALAEAPISNEWRDEILAMMDEPRRCMTIRDGATLHGTSYWHGGQQYDERLHRVEGDWSACGWWTVEDGQMRGFVELLACGNWQPISQPAPPPMLMTPVSAAIMQPIHATTGGRLSTLPLGASDWPEHWTIRTPGEPETPAPIPLPGAWWMMLAALGGLAMMRRKV